MASGSSKGFDFASDDILCSYEDYANQEGSNGNHSDSAIATNPAKEFHKSRMARTSVFPGSSYSPPDDSGNQEVLISAVERSMKKHTDNLMRFLEGLSSRLSQLELYCYNLDKSIGEMRSDLTRDHGEADVKLKFLEKHLQEVHRSVQILRDKQELADTQKELAKLQLANKESSSSHNSQQNEERSSTPDTKKTENSPDPHNQQLALALPSQVAPPPPPPPAAPQPQRPPQPMSQPQPQGYYLPPAPTPTAQYMHPQVPQPQSQYQPQPQQQQQSQLQPQYQPQPQPQQQSQLQPQYQPQSQWAQVQQPGSVPGSGSGSRPSSPQVYPQYHNAGPIEPLPQSMPYSGGPGGPPPGSSQAMTYTYGGPVQTPAQPPQPQQPPQHLKPAFGGPPGDAYAAGGPPPPPGYMMYDGEPGRVPHPQQQHSNQIGHFPQPGYSQNPQQVMRPTQRFTPNHPYNEVVEKLVSMGYRGDHVMSVIQRLDETGQTVDFNAVLDRLNGHSSGGSRGWSG
ncbi:uncharacterized protein LOC111891791 isoform X2 [Lactuca sativa]|uniref:DUF1421 domain-containing protein n=1 Tax=Lactuca sativa TaxID=4236 RepID=A0A9R1UWN5_LACSA|nr:uncharacterized protein LOC111891791 isoform X2 [Lactuca sativa]KAJ0194223.1 hypothetical protein LSAT_V11C800442860 [Lactuca sativa]